MKHILITTIAAVLLVGCEKPPPPAILIHDAAEKGSIEAIKQHLAAGTDINAKDRDGWTPLHFATRFEDLAMAELLVANGADVNAKAKNDWTPLDVAYASELRELLRKHGGKTKRELEAKESIHAAAETGNIEAVKQHLADGVNMNAEDMIGWTPLYFAIDEGHTEITELLIAKGADINAKNASAIGLNAEDIRGWTPLHCAVKKASRTGEMDVVELLIIKGANVNAKDEAKDDGGKTPLHWAVGFGQKEVVELLLRKGADVSAKDDLGMTPLHGASGYQKDAEKIAELLLANGAEVNAKRDGGWTPLNEVVIASETYKEGAAKVFALLRKHGGKTEGELKIEELKRILASTEGEWNLLTRGQDRNGRAFSNAGTMTINWDDSKSELRMESRIKRKGRTFKSLETITINNEEIIMDRGGKQINGFWRPSRKSISWLSTIDLVSFLGSSDYSIKDRISQTFSVKGFNVSSTVTTELKAEGK
jgi:ankyrin repeat protein